MRPHRLIDRLSYRTLATTATVSFALAGVAISYAAPLAVSHDDGWFAVQEGNMYSGLALGLLVSYVGVSVGRLLSTPGKDPKRHVDKIIPKVKEQDAGRVVQAGRQPRLDSHGRGAQALPSGLPQPVPVRRDGQLRTQRPSCPRK